MCLNHCYINPKLSCQTTNCLSLHGVITAGEFGFSYVPKTGTYTFIFHLIDLISSISFQSYSECKVNNIIAVYPLHKLQYD